MSSFVTSFFSMQNCVKHKLPLKTKKRRQCNLLPCASFLGTGFSWEEVSYEVLGNKKEQNYSCNNSASVKCILVEHLQWLLIMLLGGRLGKQPRIKSKKS